MAFVVEYVFTRPDTDTEWPSFGETFDEKLQSLREANGVVSEDIISDDQLVWRRVQTADDMLSYNTFYDSAQPIWDKANILNDAGSKNIAITMDIIENT